MTFNFSKLANNFTVLTYNMPSLKTVAINLIVKVGSRYETFDEAGISHFLEHMAFKGTTLRSAKIIAEEFDSLGGNFNAYTGKEQTVYYAKVLDEHFSKAMEILADIIQNSVFLKADIDKELQVILQEIAGVRDNPDELAYEEFYKIAYPDQNLGKTILGSLETLSKFNYNSFKNFLSKHYTPENMFLSIAGNIDHASAVKSAEMFLPLKPRLRDDFQFAKYCGGFSLLNKDLEQTTLILGFESIAYTDLRGFYHAQILSLILGGGISSRLFQRIRENLGLAYSVGAYNNAYKDTGLFCIYASASHEKLSTLIDNLANEIIDIKSNIFETELQKAKEQIKISIHMAEEKSSYKSEEIGKNYAIFDKYYSADEILAYIFESSLNDITKAAIKIFSSKPTLSIVGSNSYSENDYIRLCQALAK